MAIYIPDKDFFKWIYDRLVFVHGENPDIDYMRSLKERIDKLPTSKKCPTLTPTDYDKSRRISQQGDVKGRPRG
jgi:hypothetical protein